jgi:hypothetical protein
MTLHEAIDKVLADHPSGLFAGKIADEIERRGLYVNHQMVSLCQRTRSRQGSVIKPTVIATKKARMVGYAGWRRG